MTDGERLKYADDLAVLQIAIAKVARGSQHEAIYTAMSLVLGTVLEYSQEYTVAYENIMREIRSFGVAAVTQRERDKRGS